MKIFGRKNNSGEMSGNDAMSNDEMNRSSDQSQSNTMNPSTNRREGEMSYSGSDRNVNNMWDEQDEPLKNNDRGGSRNGSNFS